MERSRWPRPLETTSASPRMRPVASPSDSQPPHWVWSWVPVGITVVERRLLNLIHMYNLPPQIAIAEDVTRGTPVWKAFQNRLLGPEMVHAASAATHQPFAVCYRELTYALLLATNALSFVLFRGMGSTPRVACAYTLAVAGLFLALQDTSSLYLWDYIELLINLLFAYGVFRRLRLRFFVMLFLVGLLNHESALFIPLWLILDAWRPSRVLASPRRFRVLQAAVGAVLVVAGIGFTSWLRTRLYHGVEGGAYQGIAGQQLRLADNWKALHEWDSGWVMAVLFVSFVGLTWALARGARTPQRGVIGLLIGLMALSNLLFGLLEEPRVWIPLIPFALFLWQSARRPESAGASSADQLAPAL